MPLGPGKYDDVCTLVREQTAALGVIVMVINGKHGHGFSVQADPMTLAGLPEILEDIARQLRNDRAKLPPNQSPN